MNLKEKLSTELEKIKDDRAHKETSRLIITLKPDVKEELARIAARMESNMTWIIGRLVEAFIADFNGKK